MYDMILGPAGNAAWLKTGYPQGIVFHREWGRCTPGGLNGGVAAADVGPLNVFDYAINQNPVAALRGLTGGPNIPALIWDTSLKEARRVNEDFWATHVRIQVQRVTEDVAIATSTNLAAADYRQLASRLYFRFFHMKEDAPEAQGFIEDFPESMGPEYESVGTNFFTVNNGPSHFGAAKPLPKPLFYEARKTMILGMFDFGTNRGGITLTQAPQGVMVYVDGFRSPKPEELVQVRG